MQFFRPRRTKEFTRTRSEMSVHSRIELEFGFLVFGFLRRGENLSTRRKTSRSRVENQQQTQPTYDAGSGNRTQATLVGGERSHYCANTAPPQLFPNVKWCNKNVLQITSWTLTSFRALSLRDCAGSNSKEVSTPCEIRELQKRVLWLSQANCSVSCYLVSITKLESSNFAVGNVSVKLYKNMATEVIKGS